MSSEFQPKSLKLNFGSPSFLALPQLSPQFSSVLVPTRSWQPHPPQIPLDQVQDVKTFRSLRRTVIKDGLPLRRLSFPFPLGPLVQGKRHLLFFTLEPASSPSIDTSLSDADDRVFLLVLSSSIHQAFAPLLRLFLLQLFDPPLYPSFSLLLLTSQHGLVLFLPFDSLSTLQHALRIRRRLQQALRLRCDGELDIFSLPRELPSFVSDPHPSLVALLPVSSQHNRYYSSRSDL